MAVFYQSVIVSSGIVQVIASHDNLIFMDQFKFEKTKNKYHMTSSELILQANQRAVGAD